MVVIAFVVAVDVLDAAGLVMIEGTNTDSSRNNARWEINKR